MIANKTKSKKIMSDEDKRFHELMRQVRLGSEDAVRELLDLYGKHIIHVVRRRLHREMRSKFDSQDFVQAVWASFFTKPCLNAGFENSKKLIVFLAEVASNKVIEEWRKRMATEKYNVNRERSIDDSSMAVSAELRAPDPTPSQSAIANEQLSRLLEGQTKQDQQIIKLRADNATYDEIAEQLSLDEGTIRRVIRRERCRLKQRRSSSTDQ